MSLAEILERRRLEEFLKRTGDENGRALGKHGADNSPLRSEVAPEKPLDSVKPSCLEIVMHSSNQCCSLPWMCFYGAIFSTNVDAPDGTGKVDFLHLFFILHEVKVYGRNLREWRQAINTLTLAEIRETPKQYQAQANEDSSPIACHIEVKLRSR